MIKLIASDLDGTLLQKSRHVSGKAFALIRKLNERGVIFAPASGRQYTNLRRLFEPVRDDVAYICENGAYVRYKDNVLYKKSMDRELGIEIMKCITDTGDCEILLSGEEVSYLMPKNEDYVSHIRDFVGNDIRIIKDYGEVHEDFLKVSAYSKEGIDPYVRGYVNQWGEKVKIAVSGECWIDFIDHDAGKGNALGILMDRFGCDFESTMCFGDNYNDLEMFDRAYFSYAMSMSDAEIRKAARYVSPDVESILFDVDKQYEWSLG